MTNKTNLEITNKQESIIKWFNDSIIKNNDKKMHRARLYGNYKNYCKENCFIIMKKTQLLNHVYSKLGQPLKNCDYVYKGFELKKIYTIDNSKQNII